jgi:RHS repeat-associated protein
MAKLNPFMFSTKFYDWETGLYYYGARYYNPSTGRWPNRDPIGRRGGNNLYAFCYNNPIGRIDRLGRMPTFEYSSEGEAYYNGGLFWDTKSDSGVQQDTTAAFFQVSATEENGNHGICDSGGDLNNGNTSSSFVTATVKNSGNSCTKLHCVCNISWSATTSNTGRNLASGGFVKGTVLGQDFYHTLDPSPSVTGAGTWGAHSDGHFAAQATISPTVGAPVTLYLGIVSVSAPPDAPGSTIFATMYGSCTCR